MSQPNSQPCPSPDLGERIDKFEQLLNSGDGKGALLALNDEEQSIVKYLLEHSEKGKSPTLKGALEAAGMTLSQFKHSGAQYLFAIFNAYLHRKGMDILRIIDKRVEQANATLSKEVIKVNPDGIPYREIEDSGMPDWSARSKALDALETMTGMVPKGGRTAINVTTNVGRSKGRRGGGSAEQDLYDQIVTDIGGISELDDVTEEDVRRAHEGEEQDDLEDGEDEE